MQDIQNQKGKKLSGSTIKLIAILSMFVDHLGASGVVSILSDNIWVYEICRLIGRIAFPLFCFLLVEGFVHTGNRKAYLGRLFLFALLSEIPFDLAFYNRWFYIESQNVFFTLFLGLLTLHCIDAAVQANHKARVWIPMVLGGIAAWGLRTDYSYFGVWLIVVFYWFRGIPWRRNVVAGCSCLWEPAAILALIPIQLYNGRRGINLKYLFYWFYPVHLLCLWYLREYLW